MPMRASDCEFPPNHGRRTDARTAPDASGFWRCRGPFLTASKVLSSCVSTVVMAAMITTEMSRGDHRYRALVASSAGTARRKESVWKPGDSTRVSVVTHSSGASSWVAPTQLSRRFAVSRLPLIRAQTSSVRNSV
jgi:hypothetical protein